LFLTRKGGYQVALRSLRRLPRPTHAALFGALPAGTVFFSLLSFCFCAPRCRSLSLALARTRTLRTSWHVFLFCPSLTATFQAPYFLLFFFFVFSVAAPLMSSPRLAVLAAHASLFFLGEDVSRLSCFLLPTAARIAPDPELAFFLPF